MEILAIVRVLWRRRMLVAPGAVAAFALMLVVGAAPSASTGVAWTRLALDTRPSQLVAPVPGGVDTLGWRSTLLAELTTSEPVEARIAKDVGVPADALVIVEPLLEVPAAPTALPRRAAKAAAVRSEPYVVVVNADEPLATISIEASAPDRRAAVRLADATAKALEAAGPALDVPQTQPYRVERAADIRSEAVAGGADRMTSIAVAVVVLGLWCGILAVLPGSRRARRDGVSEPRATDAPAAA